jgi:hypothetical protein
MKTNTETGEAITRAMDWLGQLREEDYREEDYPEPAFDGDGEPDSASAPAAAAPGPAVPAARPAVPVSGWPTAPPEAHVPEPPVPATRWSAAVRGRHAAVAGAAVPVAEAPVPLAEAPVPLAEAPVPSAGPPAPVATPPVAVAGSPATTAGPPLAAAVPAADPGSRGSERSEDPPPAERAPIGEELRIPTAWCEMDSCISHYAHPAALGEVDNRSRAITVGWRIDAFGRLTCPQCQQGPWFWATQQMVPWDRSRAVAMATLMTAVQRAADYREPAAAAGPAMLPPVEQALAPLPLYDRG